MRDALTVHRRDVLNWYALYTRPRFEKMVDSLLCEKGLESYLPLQTFRRQWSDRKKKVQEPLFSCYVFVRVASQQRMHAVETRGVVRMVSFNGTPSRIPDDEINALKGVLEKADFFEPAPYLAVGQMVEVIRGPFKGIRGRLTQHRGQKRLLVGIEKIRQAIRVEVDGSEVRPLIDQYDRPRAA